MEENIKVSHQSEDERNERIKEISSNDSIDHKDLPDNASKAFELILQKCGDYHLYQWKLTIVTGFSGFFSAIYNLSAIFLAATPKYFCENPNIKEENITEIQTLANISSPWIRGKEGIFEPSKCQYYDHDFTLESIQNDSYENESFNNSFEIRDCDSWIYSDEVFKTTAVTEWNLVCNDKWLMSTTQSSYMMGILVGAIVFSALSDRIGRRLSALICCGMLISASISVAFTKSFTVFLILRFIVAASSHGLVLSTYVILMESVSLKGRNIMGNLASLWFVVGFFYLILMSFFIRDWRILQLALSLPTITLVIFLWVLPESSRWLLMQRREEEGIKVLKSISKTNKIKYPPDEEIEPLLKIIRNEVQYQPNVSTLEKIKSTLSVMADLVRTPNMRRRSLIIFNTWFVVSMTYYGLTFSSANLSSSIHVSMAWSALAEFIASIATILLLLIMGRRTLTSLSFILGGLSCVSVMFLPTRLVAWNLALTTFGKLCATIAFILAYMLSAELVPTHIRNNSLGISSMFARIGSALAPYIVDLLGDVYYGIPFIIFGVLALIAGILVLLLPETGDKCMPESIKEIESMPR